MREIGRRLDVNHQSVANWIKAYARFLPPDVPADLAEMAKLEGLFIL